MADKKKTPSPQRRRRTPAQAAQSTQNAQQPMQRAGDPPAIESATVPRTLFAAPIAVRWRDLDAFNHVNNSNFLTYIEEARLQWLKNVPGPWFHAHSMPVLAAAELNYRAPIAWPASIAVELSCERVGNSSITLGHRIIDVNEPQKVYCDGRSVLVWTDPATGQSVALPEAIRTACAM